MTTPAQKASTSGIDMLDKSTWPKMPREEAIPFLLKNIESNNFGKYRSWQWNYVTCREWEPDGKFGGKWGEVFTSREPCLQIRLEDPNNAHLIGPGHFYIGDALDALGLERKTIKLAHSDVQVQVISKGYESFLKALQERFEKDVSLELPAIGTAFPYTAPKPVRAISAKTSGSGFNKPLGQRLGDAWGVLNIKGAWAAFKGRQP